MKTILFKSLLFAALSLFAAIPHLQAQNVEINETTFPDPNFRNWVLSQTYGADGVLTTDEISAVTSINVYNMNISSLQGIEYFTTLIYLSCYNNKLDSLDVSKNTALTNLNCYNNKLTSLVLPNSTALTRLDCYYNQLDTLDVSKNTALTNLNCYNNKLTSLVLPDSAALIVLSCHYNQLTSLVLPNSTALRDLYCHHNFLQDLDLSNYPSLTDVSISPQYPVDEVVVGGSNRDKLVVPFPTLELDRISNLQSYGAGITPEKVTINGVSHLVIASSGNADLHHTEKNNSQVTYTLTPKYHPDVSNRPTMQVYLRHLPYHALYLNPVSEQNGVFTGTLCLDVPTVIPTDCDLKAYAAEGITQASEEAGQLVLSQAKTGVLPTGSAIVVTATEPGLHLFKGYAELDDTRYNQASAAIFYNTSPEAYTGNLLAGTYDAGGLTVPYGSVLTLGPRHDDGSGTIGFWNYSGTQIPPFRCYIPTSEIPSMNSGGGTRFMGLSLLFPDEEGTVTGIDTAPAGSPASAIYYDLQGRRVADPRKGGIYIVGGKKVVY